MARPHLVIAGASGVVGRHLIAAARPRYRITTLSRHAGDHSQPQVTTATWNPRAAREGDHNALRELQDILEGAEAVVNLAGASIADGRFDASHRRRILESRLDSTTTLVAALQGTVEPPGAWFQASAVGYYGDRGEDELDEYAGQGRNSFLADVCARWETAAAPAGERSRLIIGRTGLVLAADAPAWRRLLLPIRLGVGGPLGNGRQWYPWIDADDLSRAILFLLEHPQARGVYNLTTIEPVRQLDLARRVARRLHRPAVMPAPAPLLRLVLGAAADALLLTSSRALPYRLEALGFSFEYPRLEPLMEKLLNHRTAPA